VLEAFDQQVRISAVALAKPGDRHLVIPEIVVLEVRILRWGSADEVWVLRWGSTKLGLQLGQRE